MLYQLLRPFDYLSIKNVGIKVVYDYYIPLILSLSTMLIVLASNTWEPLLSFKENKIPHIVFDIVKNLPGFYIAALAAIATFSRDNLDEVIKNQANSSPTIKVRHVDHAGKVTNEQTKISRRVLLTFLFSFLTSVSFLILCSYLVLAGSGLFNCTNLFFLLVTNFVFSFLFWQLITCTFFGLYYLADKLHQ